MRAYDSQAIPLNSGFEKITQTVVKMEIFGWICFIEGLI